MILPFQNFFSVNLKDKLEANLGVLGSEDEYRKKTIL
jgi:hypothetical protein